jgi:hypothetical protein
MVRKHSYSLATFQALVLLLSLYCFMYLLSYPTSYHFEPGFGPSSSSDFNATLSEETPIFRYNATYEVIWMEVSSLHTNDTPVRLSILGESGALLNATNVTSVSGFSIIAARGQSDDFWLQVERLQSDASINITLKFWGVILPPAIDIVYPWGLLVYSIPAFLYSFYNLGKMILNGLNGKAHWKFGRGPASITLLLILGVACFIPLTYGNQRAYFIPVYTEQVSHEAYTLILNESFPSDSIELIDVYPEAVYGTTFRVYNFSVSNYPILISSSDMSEENITLGRVENEGSWWFLLTVRENNSFTLTFQRIDTDLEMGFTVETKYGIYVARFDPFVPNLLALIGCGFSVLAIGLGIRIDLNYRKESYREESYDAVPIQ